MAPYLLVGLTWLACANPQRIDREGPRTFVYTDSMHVQASPEVTWGLLADLEGYSRWNPWIVQAAGEMEPGGDALATVRLGDREQLSRHVVQTVVPEKEFCWRDAGWSSAMVYGHRCRWLEAKDGGTLVRQELVIHGPWAPSADRMYGEHMRNGMRAELEALAATARGSLSAGGLDSAHEG